jgi:hypothetical protein
MKILSVGAEFHAGERADGWTDGQRQTDVTKLTVAFRNFANAPKSPPLCIVNSFLTDLVTYDLIDFRRIKIYFLRFWDVNTCDPNIGDGTRHLDC